MDKIIIDNYTKLEPAMIFEYVSEIMAMGMVFDQGTRYCPHTRFPGGVNVESPATEEAIRFIITDAKQGSNQ
jgi:hypothetical protein